jgi:hypothetical protein
MAWSPPAHNAGIVWVSAPGDYATFNSNHTPDGTIEEMTALQKEFQIFQEGRSFKDSVRILNLGGLWNWAAKNRYYKVLEYWGGCPD